MPLAYFITFTTYGNRLPGCEDGSVDKRHNAYGTPFLDADPEREHFAYDAMTQPPYTMSAEERQIVRNAIVQFAEERGWDLLAVHVRTTHVHVVISAERDPGRLMSDLKARASRDLNDAGFDGTERKRWARHGSTKHLFREDSIDAAVVYTLDEQGERMAWYAKEPRTK